MSQENETQQKPIDANALIRLFRKYFNFPDTQYDLLDAGGLTDRQRASILLLSDKRSIEEVTEGLTLLSKGTPLEEIREMDLTPREPYTYNAYDALNSVIDKVLKAVILMDALTKDYDKTVITALLDRALEVDKKRNGKDRFCVPVIKPGEEDDT